MGQFDLCAAHVVPMQTFETVYPEIAIFVYLSTLIAYIVCAVVFLSGLVTNELLGTVFLPSCDRGLSFF
jgi:hypothetical protein